MKNIKFNKAKVIENIISIIPAGFPQKRLKDGMYRFNTYWKHGELKKVELDQEDISKKLNLNEVQGKIEEILKMASKFRFNFTGRVDLNINIKDSQIQSVYRIEANFIIRK